MSGCTRFKDTEDLQGCRPLAINHRLDGFRGVQSMEPVSPFGVDVYRLLVAPPSHLNTISSRNSRQHPS